MSSNQRIDYVRQNIEKFGKKNPTSTASKTPTNLIKQKRLVNDENTKPTNSNNKINYLSKGNSVSKSITKVSNSLSKGNSKVSSSIKKQQNDQVDGSKFERKQQIKTNLIDKINKNNVLATKNQLINNNDKQNVKKNDIRRLSNEKRLSNERRLSNEKAIIKATDKQIKSINKQNDLKSVINDKQVQNSTNENSSKRVSVSKDKSNERLNERSNERPNPQVKHTDKATKLAIHLNEDPIKNRLFVESNLLKLKYLNSKCELKLRKQNQNVIDIVRGIFNLIELNRENCLELEQQLTIKETLLFLLKLSKDSLKLLRDVDLNKIEIYLNLVSNIINSVLSSVKVIDLKNAKDVNDILNMTIAKLTKDLKMDAVQEFTDKIKQFDSINQEIFETFEHIRSLKSNLIDEVNKRSQLNNIY